MSSQTDKLVYKGNTTNQAKPIWNEYEDAMGRSTLEIHTPKKIWESCKKHHFVCTDSLGNLECIHCGQGQKIVWGIHKLHNGKIIKV